jgi:hypothetical protein
MRIAVALVVSCLVLQAASSPENRTVTDPKSITSSANPNAAPASLEELVDTRSISSPAWSPDGREIVFTTNVTGRNNLWRVPSRGGWPIQLTQSDDREPRWVNPLRQSNQRWRYRLRHLPNRCQGWKSSEPDAAQGRTRFSWPRRFWRASQ